MYKALKRPVLVWEQKKCNANHNLGGNMESWKSVKYNSTAQKKLRTNGGQPWMMSD